MTNMIYIILLNNQDTIFYNNTKCEICIQKKVHNFYIDFYIDHNFNIDLRIIYLLCSFNLWSKLNRSYLTISLFEQGDDNAAVSDTYFLHDKSFRDMTHFSSCQV